MDVTNELLLNMFGPREKSQYYRYFPKVVPTNEKSTITIMSDVSRTQKITGTYSVLIAPYHDFEYEVYGQPKAEQIIVEAHDNRIEFSYDFGGEQGYMFRVSAIVGDKSYPLLTGMVYALDEDLYHKKALKGDFHSHTNFSDGFESPEMSILAARKHGMDFIAITDHNNMNGVEVAKEVPRKLGLNITVIGGEEYSSDFTKMHIISLGNEKPLDKRLITHELERELDREVPHEEKPYELTQLLVDKIHQNGGLAVMCHPFWKYTADDGNRYDIPESLVLKLLENNKFDGYEVVATSDVDDGITTDVQLAYLQEAGKNSKDVAYLGVTDAHRYTVDDVAGKHYTIVFSEDASEKGILKALKDKQTVAVEILGDKVPKCYGSLRLVKYAHFLINHVFPEHDQLIPLEVINAQLKHRPY